jgi:hypothetical protein
MTKVPSTEKSQIRRRYPRRTWKKKIGILYKGVYFVCSSNEVGEGGMSVVSTEYVMETNQMLVVTFWIPSGDPVCVLAEIKSVKKEKGEVIHGLAFKDISFSLRRQIRTFVSERAAIANA